MTDSIVRHLCDPELSSAAIAAAHFISVRHLHVLFRADEWSVGRRIRAERLRRCPRELLEPAAARDGVAAVARRLGFVRPSHFSRAFREEYGQSRATGGSRRASRTRRQRPELAATPEAGVRTSTRIDRGCSPSGLRTRVADIRPPEIIDLDRATATALNDSLRGMDAGPIRPAV
ncbi:helix-turn-helix domain-containing protein [Streptomyces rubiginosohelvolus]|uniref:helix-turn-helix domain-containing protein n=1 Tax=Streptomyces rubiginosohelvolus TaxID=67362 RepID=UPI0036FCF524